MINPNADAVTNKGQALAINSGAAQGLASVMRSNIGPTGTMKMLVDGAGEITLTKDGSHLLASMQIQHPTAQLISRAASAQDDIVGDGTSSTVVFIGELLKQAQRYLSEGVHPRFDCRRIRRRQSIGFGVFRAVQAHQRLSRQGIASVCCAISSEDQGFGGAYQHFD